MYDYVIGIDGGGTKTLGVLYDFNGKEIKRIQVGFSSFTVDEERSKSTIIKLISELVLGIVKTKKVFIQMGISGASRLSDPKSFIKEIEKKFDCDASLEIDAIISLYAVPKKQDESLIMAIGGTGSVIMINNNKEINRLGGWGHLLGGGGSAYHLVISAFKKLTDEYDSGVPFSLVSKHLIKVVGAETSQKIVEFVYNTDKSTLAKLSLEIQTLGKKDPVVKKLLINEGKLLAEQIILAYKRYVKEGKVVVALRGSFALKALYVKETVMEEVKKEISNIRFDIDGPEPVYGAYVLAKNKIEKMLKDV